MSYDYIKRMYPVTPKIGERVTHKETGQSGVITRENRSAGHYVQVRFDGRGYSSSCHPTALEYLGQS